jgi:hypothetical protein
MKTDFFDTIQLDGMNRVKLMNRTDRKFWFHFDNLRRIFPAIIHDYYVLTIEGKNELPYTTTYYDTVFNKMYTAHHNGKRNRYKIRRRSYISSELSFLEVKFKNNKGRTIKKRISAEFNSSSFTPRECEFIEANTPFRCEDLETSLINEFSRITLVNKNFMERCTIDLNLQYTKGKKSATLRDLVIVEIKSEGNHVVSPLALALREQRIKTSGFSKYCIGRTILDQDIKHNAFKGKIRSIEKTIHTNINVCYNN